ncbi:MAG: hypothetical protein WC832_07535 [Anaerolineales bacterium]
MKIVITFDNKKPVKTGLPQADQLELPPLPEVVPAAGLHAYSAEAGRYGVDKHPAAPPTWVGIHASKIGKVIPLILFSDIANATKWLLAPGANPETLAHGPGWSSADDVWDGGVSYILKLGGRQ